VHRDHYARDGAAGTARRLIGDCGNALASRLKRSDEGERLNLALANKN
jgi:hypothetical protein